MRRFSSRLSRLLGCWALIVTSGCQSSLDISQTPTAPPWAKDTPIPVASGPGAGFNPDRVLAAVDQLDARPSHKLYGLLVARDGNLVFERYFNGRTPYISQDIRSVTKSITALLTGIAIDEGIVPGPEAPVAPLLASAYPGILSGELSVPDTLTVHHLLTMSSGKACNDHRWLSPGNENRMYRSTDWTRFFLRVPQVRGPGREAEYCTGGVIALGRIMEAGMDPTGGASFVAWADQRLFAPLGINTYRWARYGAGKGSVDTGGHLTITPRGLLKIGILLANEGQWEGRQVVPAEWIERMWTPEVELYGEDYGYLWWIKSVDYGTGPIRVLSGRGNGGQSLFVVPSLELVAVITGGYFNDERAQIADQLFFGTVLPGSLQSATTSTIAPEP